MEKRHPNPQELHRFYQAHEAEIANDANAFGLIWAMNKWQMEGATNPIGLATLKKIMERRGNGQVPVADKQAMYPSHESYCQGVVKEIIHTIEDLKDTVANLEDQNVGKDAIIAEKDKRIKKLQEEKQSFGALGRQKEETIMKELLNKIK